MFGRKLSDRVIPSGTPPEKEAPRVESKPMLEKAIASKSVDSAARRPGGAGGTVVGEDTVFQGGRLVSKGTLRIDGTIEGEVLAEDSIVVGPTGIVRGNLAARHVAVSGKVFGNVVAYERLELQPSSEVHGDVQTAAGALIIEGGAKLDGKCIMAEPEDMPKPQRPQPPPQQQQRPGEHRPPAEVRPVEHRPEPAKAEAPANAKP
jgi:cytoskeletal protein CcmA (bactofilin family)